MKNKIKVEYACFCDYALVSSTGKASIMGIFDEFTIENIEEKILISKCFVYIFLRSKPNTTQKIKIEFGDDEEPNKYDIDFAPNGGNNLIIEFVGKKLKLGRNTLKIFQDKTLIGSASMSVHQEEKPVKTKILN